MYINVAQLLKQPIGSARSYKVDDVVQLVEGERADYHVLGKIDLTRTDRGILIRGTLETEISLTCSRCLTLFKYPLVLRVEEEDFPKINVVSGFHLPLPEDATNYIIDEHHMLDLGEVVRQHTLLTIPMKPLCHPECAGICPGYGINLNQGTCQCPPRSQESPWAELEKLASARKLK
jgi:uncharacterized protein